MKPGRLSLILLLSVAAFADPGFDVASVRIGNLPGPESITIEPGALTMKNVSLRR